jgi:hypothetical protein
MNANERMNLEMVRELEIQTKSATEFDSDDHKKIYKHIGEILTNLRLHLERDLFWSECAQKKHTPKNGGIAAECPNRRS